uniref:Hyaluronan synthase 1 n=2 Tax=Talaromyces marneffei TaxID=37727 RepID=A0A093VSB1_TALMA
MEYLTPAYLTITSAILGQQLISGFPSILTPKNVPFLSLFVIRYLRLIVHTISYWLLYRPIPIPQQPHYGLCDVTVIVPTVDPENTDFVECILSIISNKPKKLIIVVPSKEMVNSIKKRLISWRICSKKISMSVLRAVQVNKRAQVACAIPHVRTAITIIADDHVFWRSPRFLSTILAPFEDPRVGAVGTNKRAIRAEKGFTTAAFWNMLGAIYLERQDFDVRATNALDGGVFVNSGRTSAHRTSILQSPNFLEGYLNERFFFGLFGPLNCDDDNYITRYEVRYGWNIKIQHCPHGLMETPLGTYPKYLSQCLRWARTTWRSNSASLFSDRTVWRRQPWCVYAVYLTSFINFALFYDFALVYFFSHTTWARTTTVLYLLAWILVSKLVKLIPYFLRHPKDLIFLPGYYAFAYFHSLIKFYALLTFWDVTWSGRQLDRIDTGEENYVPKDL